MIFVKNPNDESVLKLNKHRFDKYSLETFFKSRESVVLLIILSVLILIWRRPGQAFYPYIWDEDGAVILYEYIHKGMLSLLKPVNGYLVTSSRLLDILSIRISFWYYPEIAAALANIFIVASVLAIAYSPTHLRMPWLCGVFTLLVKSDPECFGVALYSFWWAGLLLILAVLWKSEERPVLRNLFVLLGGFSSPLIMIAAPMLLFRAIYERKRNEIIAACVSVVPLAVQTWTMMNNRNTLGLETLSFRTVGGVIVKYFGNYVYNFNVKTEEAILSAIIGTLFLLALIFCGVRFKKSGFKSFFDSNLYYFLMLGWLFAAILSSAMRVDVFKINQFMAGPRYYFYPFIFISWLSVWIISENGSRVIKFIFGIILVTFLFDGSIHYMTRDHYRGDWRGNLSECMRKEGEYKLPVHFAGYRDSWDVRINGEECRMLINKSFIFNNTEVCIKNGKKNCEDIYAGVMRLENRKDGKEKYNIERINGVNLKNGAVNDKIELKDAFVPISGWAIDEINGKAPDDILLKIGGGVFTAKIQARNDITQQFSNQDYLYSGYNFDVPKRYFSEGENKCELIVVSSDKKGFWNIPFSISVSLT